MISACCFCANFQNIQDKVILLTRDFPRACKQFRVPSTCLCVVTLSLSFHERLITHRLPDSLHRCVYACNGKAPIQGLCPKTADHFSRLLIMRLNELWTHLFTVTLNSSSFPIPSVPTWETLDSLMFGRGKEASKTHAGYINFFLLVHLRLTHVILIQRP